MFGKVFDQIFDSSIANNVDLRHFFMDMIVMADADGDVDKTPEAIAGRTRIPLDQVLKHLEELSSPDKRSRTPDLDGRRIELLDEHRDWGWKIVNYRKFRDIASNEQRKAKQRDRFHRWKLKKKEPANAPLTPTNATNAMQKQRQKQRQKQGGGVRGELSSTEIIVFSDELKEVRKELATLSGSGLLPSSIERKKFLAQRKKALDEMLGTKA